MLVYIIPAVVSWVLTAVLWLCGAPFWVLAIFLIGSGVGLAVVLAVVLFLSGPPPGPRF